MLSVKAYGTEASDLPLKAMSIERRELGPKDVAIEILYCGVCHTDLHMAKNHLGYTIYPIVPGHEMVGKITAVGAEVTKFKIGDIGAVGPIANTCGRCNNCQNEREVYCENGLTGVYGTDPNFPGKATYGGYSQRIVVDEHFTYKVPDNLDMAGVGPLVCAGITVWAPLREAKVGKNQKVAVVGLGGLGHLAIKLAKALGAEVSLFSRTPGKIDDALELGVDKVIISTEEEQMQKADSYFDLIIDTVPYNHDVNPYLATLAIDGKLVLVGHMNELNPQ